MSVDTILTAIRIAMPLIEEIIGWLRTGKVAPLPDTLSAWVAHEARKAGLK